MIKFDEFVNVVFLTNLNLSSIKISRTKLTRIQIMKSNSNFKEKTSHSSLFFIHFFTFCIIFNSKHTFYYSALLPYSLNSSYSFCTIIGVVPMVLYTIKFFAYFEFLFSHKTLESRPYVPLGSRDGRGQVQTSFGLTTDLIVVSRI